MSAVLYYDGLCPLCAKEMRVLRRWKSESLQLVDIHAADLNEDEKAKRLQVLHLETSPGTYLLGVDASVAAWSYTAFGWVLRPLQWRLFAPLVQGIYARWAKRRYEKLYGCTPSLGCER
jgi:predicted DCC family thiol-disulfide oxidoreductase YuxK